MFLLGNFSLCGRGPCHWLIWVSKYLFSIVIASVNTTAVILLIIGLEFFRHDVLQ